MQLQKAKLVKRTLLTEDVLELVFENKQPMDFQAGQFISVKVEDDPKSPCIRGYSIASAPAKNSKNFTLCIKLLENGRGSNWLKALQEGDSINFLGPNGKFLFNENFRGFSLFIATGAGISPLKSIIENQLINKKNRSKFHLIFGVRHINGIFYDELFQNLSKKFQNFTYEITVSKPEKEISKYKKGRVTDILKTLEINPNNTESYLCGLKDMITEVTSILESKGLSPENIHKEQYD